MNFVPRILLDAPQHRKISKPNLFFALSCFLSNEFLSKFPERKPNENRYGECPGGRRCDPQNLSNGFAFFSFPRLTDRLFESFGSCSPIHKKAAGIFSCTGCILPGQIKSLYSSDFMAPATLIRHSFSKLQQFLDSHDPQKHRKDSCKHLITQKTCQKRPSGCPE